MEGTRRGSPRSPRGMAVLSTTASAAPSASAGGVCRWCSSELLWVKTLLFLLED